MRDHGYIIMYLYAYSFMLVCICVYGKLRKACIWKPVPGLLAPLVSL
jgi:hypothetical protein